MIRKIKKEVGCSFKENIQYMDQTLPVEKSFDIIRREMEIGGKESVFYYIDGFIKDEAMLKIMDSFLSITAEDLPQDAETFSKQNLERNVSVEDMIYPVFKEINYLTYEEMKGFNSRIVTYGKEKAAVRQKRKGDALTENGMYVNAIRVYQKLLEREDLSEQRKGFAASVRYNLGCAYSYLFQMEKAQECFLEAYREEHSKEALKAYIIAYSSVHDKTDYDKVMEELEVDEELKKGIKEEIRQSLKAFESVPEEKTDEKNLDALLERLMKDYHRSTGS